MNSRSCGDEPGVGEIFGFFGQMPRLGEGLSNADTARLPGFDAARPARHLSERGLPLLDSPVLMIDDPTSP